MNIKIIPPVSIKGDISLPYSKSISNRVLTISKLCNNKNKIENIAVCDDTTIMIDALSNIGNEINTGNAGTATRFITAYLSTLEGERVITGSPRMKQRPIGELVRALVSMGADISYIESEGFLPLKITGNRLNGGEIELSGEISSQYISAILMIAPYTRNGVNIELTGNIISLPYINMTLSLMKQFGIDAKIKGNKISVPAGEYNCLPYRVEADWSAASYWYGFAALTDDVDIRIKSLDSNSIQGDSKISEFFVELGVTTEYEDGYVSLRRCKPTKGDFIADFTDTPDIAQTVVVTAAILGRHFRISGLQSLRIKETDRIAALVNEMRKLGYILDDSQEGTLSWSGERCEAASCVAIDTYDDHRMAMSFAIAAFASPNITIKDCGVVSKSYPNFWDDLKRVGFNIEEV